MQIHDAEKYNVTFSFIIVFILYYNCQYKKNVQPVCNYSRTCVNIVYDKKRYNVSACAHRIYSTQDA